MTDHGKFVISLDFELAWGVLGVENMDVYKHNIEGVQQVIPETLDLFSKYGIQATFSTVGFLFFKNKRELLQNLPPQSLQPHYERFALTHYGNYMNSIPDNDENDIYHFAPDLIAQIKSTAGQEIGTHTFSHYYCLENGQTLAMFQQDLELAKQTAAKNDLKLESIVFPKNQYNEDYIKACIPYGIKVYRGNPDSSFLKLRSMENENYFRKAQRFADAYCNLSGHNCYSDEFIKKSFPYNIPGSRFLRPFSGKLKILDGLRLNRIKEGMLYAARNNQAYHLWWHPHNFGINQKANFDFLEKILIYYQQLNSKYNFKSYSMIGLVNEFEKFRS